MKGFLFCFFLLSFLSLKRKQSSVVWNLKSIFLSLGQRKRPLFLKAYIRSLEEGQRDWRAEEVLRVGGTLNVSKSQRMCSTYFVLGTVPRALCELTCPLL